MGNARWDDGKYRSYSASVSNKSQEQIFSRRSIDPNLDPGVIGIREARDSEANPESTPIMLFSDVTGSMGELAEHFIRTGLGDIMRALYEYKPVSDPQIACGATGDSQSDSAPLQVTQFEAGVDPLVAQLERIYIEHGGGGNGGESYSLAWMFAALRTKTDCYEKRGRKGYLFTIGDECVHHTEGGHNILELLTAAQKLYHVYHLIVRPHIGQPVVRDWSKLLDTHAVVVEDIKTISDVIVAIIRLNEGQVNFANAQSISASVLKATAHLIPSQT